MLWRQGDVLISRIDAKPVDAQRRPDLVLAEGEATGHRHRVEDPQTAELYELSDTLYLDVKTATATIVHEEHGPIKLERGVYRVWKQREYVPQAGSRDVLD